MIKNTQQIVEFMKSFKDTYEIIIINDGSKDNTINILNNEVKFYLEKQRKNTNLENFKIITYECNQGKGYAVKQGIKNSIGKIVLFMDADLSTNLIAICDVLKYKNEDVIIGSRKIKGSNLTKKQGYVRQLIGNCCRFLTNIIVPLYIIDTQCGFKAFNGDFAREMISKQTINRFAFDVEYLYIAKLNGKNIIEIPVIWENDEDSKVSLFDTSIDFFKSLIRIRKNKPFYFLEERGKIIE